VGREVDREVIETEGPAAGRTGDDVLTGAWPSSVQVDLLHILWLQGQYQVMLEHEHALDALAQSCLQISA
jgi:hypothetical protein